MKEDSIKMQCAASISAATLCVTSATDFFIAYPGLPGSSVSITAMYTVKNQNRIKINQRIRTLRRLAAVITRTSGDDVGIGAAVLRSDVESEVGGPARAVYQDLRRLDVC